MFEYPMLSAEQRRREKDLICQMLEYVPSDPPKTARAYKQWREAKSRKMASQIEYDYIVDERRAEAELRQLTIGMETKQKIADVRGRAEAKKVAELERIQRAVTGGLLAGIATIIALWALVILFSTAHMW